MAQPRPFVGALHGGPIRLDAHRRFRNDLTAAGIGLYADSANGDYCCGGLDQKARRLLALEPCALVGADSRATMALIDARRRGTGSQQQIPIVVSVPGNPSLEPLLRSEPNMFRAHEIQFGELTGLAWMTHDLLLQSRKLQAQNVIVVVKNNSNPGSDREALETGDWFAHLPSVSVAAEGVSCERYPGYDADEVVDRIRARPDVANVRAVLAIGDPASHLYRGRILDFARNELHVPTALQSFPAMTAGGTICFAANHDRAWQRLTRIVIDLCAGREPPSPDDGMGFAVHANSEAAEAVGISNWRDIRELAGVPCAWGPPFPQESEIRYEPVIPKAPQV